MNTFFLPWLISPGAYAYQADLVNMIARYKTYWVSDIQCLEQQRGGTIPALGFFIFFFPSNPSWSLSYIATHPLLPFPSPAYIYIYICLNDSKLFRILLHVVVITSVAFHPPPPPPSHPSIFFVCWSGLLQWTIWYCNA